MTSKITKVFLMSFRCILFQCLQFSPVSQPASLADSLPHLHYPNIPFPNQHFLQPHSCPSHKIPTDNQLSCFLFLLFYSLTIFYSPTKFLYIPQLKDYSESFFSLTYFSQHDTLSYQEKTTIFLAMKYLLLN